MKVIWHQAPCENVTHREDVLFRLCNEVDVILFFKEDGLPVVAPVVEVINLVIISMHGTKVCKIRVVV